MRVAHSAPDQIDIRGRDAMRAPLLLGVAVVLSVGLGLVATREITSPPQVAAWSAVGIVGLLAVLFGWPRVHRVALKRGENLVHVNGAPEAMPAAETRLRLSIVRTDGGEGDYGVVLERSSRPGQVLLADARPDEVLRDLALIRRVAPLSVATGWGLPSEAALLNPDDGSMRSGATRPAATPVVPKSGRTKRSIAGTMLVGSVGVTAIVVVDVWKRIALGNEPSVLSLTLPVLSITILVAIALGIWTSRTSLVLGSDLVFTRHIYGFPIERRSVARSSIRAGYLVSPDGATPRHLLLDTDAGLVSVPCDPVDGARVLAALYGGPEISSAPPEQSRE